MTVPSRTEQPRGAAPTAGSRPVAVVLSRFPVVTQTFILRELIELERQGVPVVLVSLTRGRDQVVHPLARAWVERAIYPRPLGGSVLVENLRVLFQSPGSYLSTLFALVIAMVWRPAKLVAALWVFPTAVWVGRRLRELGVRHVHAHFASHAAVAAWVASRVHPTSSRDFPYSVTVHGSDLFLDQTGLGLLLGRAAFVRTISHYNRNFLLERLGGSDGPTPGSVRVIHCGVDPKRYAHTPGSGEPLRDRPARIVSIGALLPNKGIAYLVEAIAFLRSRALDVECLVVGEGPLRSDLERRIRRSGLGDAVTLLGHRPEGEVAHILATSDLFVLASVVARGGKREGIPVSLMEAMATGLPVVATRITGIPELVTDGESGRLVEPGDPDELADAIRELVEQPARAAQLGRAGRRKVEAEFSLEGTVRALAAEIAATSLTF
jgi:glycosyltransferase involved in cell wall biosynthesis